MGQAHLQQIERRLKKARAFKLLYDSGLTYAAIAKEYNYSRQYIQQEIKYYEQLGTKSEALILQQTGRNVVYD